MRMTESAPSAPEPQVGIFWLLPDRATGMLVADSIPLQAAEPYGDALTFPQGHDEVWTRWQQLGARALAARGLPLTILHQEYDVVPRGRVVYHGPERHFTIYADRKLFEPATIARIVDRFGLAQQAWSLQPDAHYRT